MPQRHHDRVELVWPGKRTEVERVRLPFQTIERVNDARRAREGQSELASAEPIPDGWPNEWRNRLIWGDNKYVLSSLLGEFTGKVDLIYIDPPFATGADFSYNVDVGDIELEKQASVMEEVAYRDTWKEGIESYCQMMYDRLTLAYDLISNKGSIYLHCDPTVSHYLRGILDDVFGTDHFRNEVAWCYTGPGNFQRWFPRKHDTILSYVKANEWTFNANNVRIPHTALHAGGIGGTSTSDEYREQQLARGKIVEDWWTDCSPVGRIATERTRYPTQKPESVLTRIIKASSNPGDLVLDFFAGSGTTMVAAEKLGRRWIGADLGRYAIHTARKRLLDIPDCRPFEVQNLGRYERRYWQGKEVGEQIGEYYRFILNLYKAHSLHGFTSIHGERAGRMVHVGATDMPVTKDELRAAVEECVENGLWALDVLGWEWEMGLNPAYRNELVAQYGVDTHLYNIPREVMEERAVDADDVHFFELSVVEVSVHVDGGEATLELTDFLPALDEYLQRKARSKIASDSWSDWIDYWSVDYEYDGETFVNQWQAYRTRREPRLALVSDPHAYALGRHTAVVKVIDIFGNDTTCEVAVTVE